MPALLRRRAALALTATLATGLPPAAIARPLAARLAELTRDLEIIRPETAAPVRLDLEAALRALNTPSVSAALIGGDGIGGAAWGSAATDTLYQAASLSKLVTAAGALVLVERGRLSLDQDVNSALLSWHVAETALSRHHPVSLRELLSMQGGIGVPGYLGYAPGAPLPDLLEILDGLPPANSPPVRVVFVPGSRYAYSGGGYEIVQQLIEDASGQSFATVMQALLLGPVGMGESFFLQPLPPELARRAAAAHRADGSTLPGGWRVMPELAAGGLWSTPTDLARLLLALVHAWRGEPNPLFGQAAAQAMFTRVRSGPYGLGAAIAGSGRNLVLMKRGQNIGYQSYLLIFPAIGQGIVVMTGSDNGTTLATALIRRAAAVLGWSPIGPLLD